MKAISLPIEARARASSQVSRRLHQSLEAAAAELQAAMTPAVSAYLFLNHWHNAKFRSYTEFEQTVMPLYSINPKFFTPRKELNLRVEQTYIGHYEFNSARRGVDKRRAEFRISLGFPSPQGAFPAWIIPGDEHWGLTVKLETFLLPSDVESSVEILEFKRKVNEYFVLASQVHQAMTEINMLLAEATTLQQLVSKYPLLINAFDECTREQFRESGEYIGKPKQLRNILSPTTYSKLALLRLNA